MKKEGFVPDRDIILALTADEEGGKSNGVDWLLNNHRDLVDAELAERWSGSTPTSASALSIWPAIAMWTAFPAPAAKICMSR